MLACWSEHLVSTRNGMSSPGDTLLAEQPPALMGKTHRVAIAERFSWAVTTLAVQPADRILEIGCGHGIAVSLIADLLTGGRIFAVDRSGVMIDAALHRNAANVSSGKAILHVADLADADLPGPFDKIFAVNVSLFWQLPGAAVGGLASLVAPGGRLYVFHQPPNAARNLEVAERASEILTRHGFSVLDVLCKDIEPAPVICLVAGLTAEVSHAGDSG
jgi:SAM-dependent methyltransferase